MAKKIKFVVEEVKEDYGSLRSPEDVFPIVRKKIGDCGQEVLVVIVIDNQNRIISFTELFKGSSDKIVLSLKEIFQTVLVLGGHGFIIAHNHPTGKLEPSDADRKITQSITTVADLLGVSFLDHVICNKDDCISLNRIDNLLFMP